MNFRTQVELPKEETEIRHSDRIMLFGSCFAENIGNLLLANKFRCDVNPFGILYNPLSVAEAIRQTLSYKTYNEADLFCDRAGWHSFMHHGSFQAIRQKNVCCGLTKGWGELPRNCRKPTG